MAARALTIIGSGPAGHTAAIYAARARLNPLVYEGFMAGGVAAGGQLTTTTDVENYPGFPTGIMGMDLMDRMREQSINCGAEVLTETIERVDLSCRPFKLYPEGCKEPTLSHTVVVATGATAKRMGLPGEEDYWQRGVSACAVCDGAMPIFRDVPLVVIGGGDSACEEASHLSKFGSSVRMLVRRGEMRASKVMQDRVLSNPKITVEWNTVPVSLEGDGKLLGSVRVRDVQTGEERVLEAGGLFYAIGHTPNTAFLGGQLPVDGSQYLQTVSKGSTATPIEGVFACGDVQDSEWRQAVTAAGSGCMAALEAERWLGDQVHAGAIQLE